MAKTLQIRDVPEDVHAVIRGRAAAAGMSVSEYLLREVTESARRPTVAEVMERAVQRGTSDVSVADIVALQRADRGE